MVDHRPGDVVGLRAHDQPGRHRPVQPGLRQDADRRRLSDLSQLRRCAFSSDAPCWLRKSIRACRRKYRHVSDLRDRARRRPDRRHQPDAGRRGAGGEKAPSRRQGARRAPRRARHSRRRLCRSLGGSRGPAAADRRHAERGARQHARQARRRLLRGDPGRAEEGRRRRLHLYRRQRYGRHPADPDRGGRRLDGLRACAQDHRQRSGRQRPHAGLHLGRRVRRRRPSSASISISARCPASMSASSWAAMPAS